MNLHEYQAKEILSGFGVRIQRGYVASSPEEAVEEAKKLSNDTVIIVNSCGDAHKDKNILKAKLGKKYDQFN